MIRVLVGTVLAALLLPVPSAQASTPRAESDELGGSTGSPDVFEANTFNDVVGGVEVPYTSGATVIYSTPTLDTSSYTVQAAESGTSPNYNGCLKSPPVFAGRTAWYRFNPGVDGNLKVLATTPDYDSILMIRAATKVTWGTTQFSDLGGQAQTCADVNVGPGPEGISSFPAQADRAYYVQVGSKCPTNSPTSCSDPGIQGGPTTIRLTFEPSDSDGDGVPNTRDECPGAGLPGLVTSTGCPDRDRDGVADTADVCPDNPGVASQDQFTGCPPGPPPNPGLRAEVTIVSLTGDTLNTSSANVLLRLDWEPGTRRVLVDNGSGQPPVAVDFASGTVPWTLDPAAKSETRQVKVQFLGPGIDDRDNDTITLDVQAPTVPRAVVLPPSGGDYAVGFKVTDGKTGSGVRSVTLLNKKRKSVSKSLMCKRSSCTNVLEGLTTRSSPQYIRVVDKAGNSRDVKLPPAKRGCKVTVFSLVDYDDTKCFQPGSRCVPADTKAWDFAARNIACSKGVVVRIKK